MDHPDPKIRAMLNSFDTLHADHNRVDNPFLDNPNNGSISANDGSKSGLSAMRTPIMEKGGKRQCLQRQRGACWSAR